MNYSGLFPKVVFSSVLLLATGGLAPTPAAAQAPASADPPAVKKAEPPNWWVGLTPDLMLLLSGHGLSASKVSCNLHDVLVARTQSTQGGDYLFVWIKFGPLLRSGTAVCRITTGAGAAMFELPISNRQPTAQRFHGLDSDDVLYLIMPDRVANADPTNDEPAEFPKSHERPHPPP